MSVEFINAGSATVINKKNATWSFTSYSVPLTPYSLFECSLIYEEKTSLGFGIGPTPFEAAVRAFAEAWERCCWRTYAASNNQILSTNGFAAGMTDSLAIEAARNELIERTVMLLAWRTQSGWELQKFTSITNRIRRLALALMGWKIDLFNINSNLGTVKACLAIHKSKGAIFDTCLSNDTFYAEEKVFWGVVLNIQFSKISENFELPEIGVPQDHRKFYSKPENLQAFDFLYESSKTSPVTIYIAGEENTKSQVIYSAGNFPSVAYAKNDLWPNFCWGQQSIEGKNQWPHPLA